MTSLREYSDTRVNYTRPQIAAAKATETLQILSQAARRGLYPEDHCHAVKDWMIQWCYPEEVLDALIWGYRRGFRMSGVLWYLSGRVDVPHPKAKNPYTDLGLSLAEVKDWAANNPLRELPK